jgi:hypothetical protein
MTAMTIIQDESPDTTESNIGLNIAEVMTIQVTTAMTSAALIITGVMNAEEMPGMNGQERANMGITVATDHIDIARENRVFCKGPVAN